MFKKLFAMFVFAACAVMAGTVETQAATAIDTVYISIAMDEDIEMSPGDCYSAFEPYIEDDFMYYVDEYSLSNDDAKPRKSYTYTMTVLPRSGYYFTDNTKIEIYGAYELSVTGRSAGMIKVKAKAYPYYVLEEPSNITIDWNSGKLEWDKVEYAKSYNIIIYYTTSSGNDRSVKKTSSKNSLNISSYIDHYDDICVSVQACRGSTDADKYIADSDYVMEDGEVDDDLSDETYEFNHIPTAYSNGNGSSDGIVTSSVVYGSEPGDAVSSSGNGWAGSGDIWYYYLNGSPVTGWVEDGGNWYYCDASGVMQAGWLFDGTDFYYLNVLHDGTYGRMLTGAQIIDGVECVFHSEHDGRYGALESR